MTEEPRAVKFLFGGLSCMAAACVTNPVDVIKTRMQIQGELKVESMFAKDRKYKGFVRGITTIIEKEGIFGLYKGIFPSLLREGSYSTMRIGGYDIMKEILLSPGDNPKQMPFWKKVTAGLVSGAVGAAIANPTDLVKVRMQACDASKPKYANTFHAFRKIYAEEGIAGLYKGVIPTTQRAALLTASQLASYDQSKHAIINIAVPASKRDDPNWKEPIWIHLSSSIVAGLVCSITTSPVDLIKTRLMNQPFDANGKGTIYANSLDCFVKTIKSEGFFGIYKGFFPNWFRIGPHTIVTMIVYERLRRIAGLTPV